MIDRQQIRVTVAGNKRYVTLESQSPAKKMRRRRRQNQRFVRTTSRCTSPVRTEMVHAATQYERLPEATSCSNNNYDVMDDFFRAYYELKAANSDMPDSEEGSIDYRQATDNSTPADEHTADLQPSSVGTGSEGTGNDSLSGNTRAESGQGEMSDSETASDGHQLLPVSVILNQLQEMIQRNIVTVKIGTQDSIEVQWLEECESDENNENIE
jgi:conjugal transfer/entry exclusion protein